MENLCSACLCTNKKLQHINETGFLDIYSQILNEIQVSNIYLEIRVCFECKAILNKFNNFKEQVKFSYLKLIQCYSDVKENNHHLSEEPRLKIANVSSTTYPDIKIEYDTLDLENNDNDDFNNETVESYDFVQISDDEAMEKDKCIDFRYSVKLEEYNQEGFVNDLAGNDLKAKKKIHKISTIKKTKEKNKTKTTNKLKKKNKKEVKTKRRKRKASASVSEDYCNNLEDDLPLEGERVIENGEEVRGNETEDLESNFSVQVEQMETDELTIKRIPRTENKIVKIKSSKPNTNIVTVRPSKKVLESQLGKPECADCGKVFSSKKTLRYHLNVLHKGNNRYPCPRCGKVYQWKSNLGRHLRSHKARDTGELYCETCDKRFASVATYRQHLSISKQHVSESEFSHVCQDCGKKFVNKTRLRDHIDWEHLQKIKFKCQLCNKPFKCHTSLYVHMKNVHRNKGLKDNLCHVCGKSYQNRAKLHYHIVAMHTTETPYQCEHCEAAFGWYSSLYRHLREVHYKMKVNTPKKKSKKRLDPTPHNIVPPHNNIVLPPMPPILGQPLSLLESLNQS